VFDTSGDGLISIDELTQFLQRRKLRKTTSCELLAISAGQRVDRIAKKTRCFLPPFLPSFLPSSLPCTSASRVCTYV
jgi:hypothetical protein